MVKSNTGNLFLIPRILVFSIYPFPSCTSVVHLHLRHQILNPLCGRSGHFRSSKNSFVRLFVLQINSCNFVWNIKVLTNCAEWLGSICMHSMKVFFFNLRLNLLNSHPPPPHGPSKRILGCAQFGEFWIFCIKQVCTLLMRISINARMSWHTIQQIEHTPELVYFICQ